MDASIPHGLSRYLDEDALPYLTSELPGIGGTLKTNPEDFLVDEIPAYPPSGSGDFLFVRVEKNNIDAQRFVRCIAQTLSLSKGEIGMAGNKDRRAITRQTLSLPAAVGEAGLRAIDEIEGITVLESQRHSHKLRTGQLRGNRFSILIRDPQGDQPVEQVRKICQELSNGFPNIFGMQRFGHEGSTAKMGWELVQRPRGKEGRRIGRNRFLKRLAISALQSLVFNHYLVHRMESELLFRVLEGDWMAKRDTGGPFIVENPEEEQRRFENGETVITGPILGRKMKLATGEGAAVEQKIFDEAMLSRENFAPFGKLALGTRRPLLISAEALEVEEDPDGVRIHFMLPKGCYATSFLREVMKEERKAD